MYILFTILSLVPNCTLELILAIPSILTAPVISNVDFGFELLIPTFPSGDIDSPNWFVKLLNILKYPLLLTIFQLSVL